MPRTPIRETPAPQPAPADDDFVSRYANFDEASVAPVNNDTEHFSPSVDVPAPARRYDSATLKAAEARVPAAIRDYLASQFQAKFDRYVPAEEARIFSSRGEIGAGDTQDSATDDPDLASELDD